MKTLYLLRHATPADGANGHRDFERPLLPQGQRECEVVGRRLAAFDGVAPVGLVLCSAARRTLDTFAALRASLSPDAVLEEARELYCASRGQLEEAIREADDEHRGVLVIAHNPGIAVLASALAGKGDARTLDRMSSHFPPASLAVFNFDLDRWSELAEKSGELVHFSVPSPSR